ncbi:MAG TPA: hypothetical protein DCQ87_07375 [Lachnospiraceae bacterium]|nr:hypothetical protein [Lachnospiraceae bacterium]
MKGKNKSAAKEKNFSIKKMVLTTIVAVMLAIVVVLIWKTIVSVDPFKYLTISFDGAKPYLIPKAEVKKDAPAGIKASDFTFSTKDSKQAVFAYEGQIFTVKFKKKNNLLRNRYYSRRIKTYKVGRTPDYVRDSSDLDDPNNSTVSAWYEMDKVAGKILKQNVNKYKSYVYQGMITRLAPSYNADDKVHEAAYLIYSADRDLLHTKDVAAVELYNVAVDGRRNLSYRKGEDCLWKGKSYEDLYNDIMADYPGWDYEQDDEVNYEKMTSAKTDES